jgi:hypothetical protein
MRSFWGDFIYISLREKAAGCEKGGWVAMQQLILCIIEHKKKCMLGTQALAKPLFSYGAFK